MIDRFDKPTFQLGDDDMLTQECFIFGEISLLIEVVGQLGGLVSQHVLLHLPNH